MVSALLAIVYGVRPPPVNGTMQCVGTQALDRACLLQDLYYDTQERTFTYYGKTIANDTQKGGTVKADTDTFDSATYAPARGTCVCHATVHALLALRVALALNHASFAQTGLNHALRAAAGRTL